MAKVKEIKMYIPQGTTYEHTFNYAQSDGTPIDLTGYKARMQFRQNVDDADPPVYDVDDVSGELVCGNGTVTLTIPDADSAAFDFESVRFDLEIESPGGVVTRLVKGDSILDPEVTR